MNCVGTTRNWKIIMRLSEPKCDALILGSVVIVNWCVAVWFGAWWLLLSVPITVTAGLIVLGLLLLT
jgi:hypothetical protein